jgi:hypothetical protein
MFLCIRCNPSCQRELLGSGAGLSPHLHGTRVVAAEAANLGALRHTLHGPLLHPPKGAAGTGDLQVEHNMGQPGCLPC